MALHGGSEYASGNLFPAPFELQGGAVVRKAFHMAYALPLMAVGGFCPTGELAIVLPETPIEVRSHSDIGFWRAIYGFQKVTAPLHTYRVVPKLSTPPEA